jgi:hypothetical protein
MACGGWHAGEWETATWHARAARVQRAGVVHARRRARARSGFAGWKQFADALFKIVFLWISKQ